jgi:predicted phosphodiesterase
MRIALISDIHGNTVALDAVLADMTQPDLIVCLGDIAAGGPDPGGAVDRVAGLDCVSVRGNTDAGMVDMPAWWRDPSSIGLPEPARPGLEVSVWSAGRLTPEQRRYLADLPATATADLGEAGALLAFHGSPRSADDLVTATTPDDELDAMFAGATSSILAGGHTHVPLVRRYRAQTIVNPGSVGLPFAEYGYAGGVAVLSHAAYAMISTDRAEVNVELRQVPVDAAALEATVVASGMPHAGWWLGLRRPSHLVGG